MAAAEHKLLSTEIVNRGVEVSGPDAGSVTFSVRVQRRLPDFLQSVSLKYVRLGYSYLLSHVVYLATLPVLVVLSGIEIHSLSREEVWRKAWDGSSDHDLGTLFALIGVFVFTAFVYFLSRPRPIYLIDFACYRAPDELKVSKKDFINLARQTGKFDEASIEFQSQVLQSSGIGDETYLPKAIMSSGNCATMKEGRAEVSMVIFGVLDELFEKCHVRPKDIGILVVNCTLFNPTPSLSAMIVNRYKMRSNILSFNLGGMGCSAGIIALDLAKDMLDSNPSTLAVVVSTEATTFTWYSGRNRSMLIPNCFFRMGGSALLLSNRRRDIPRAKYQLEHIVRTHKGSENRSFRCINQEEDDQRIKGVAISRDLMEVGRQALRTNIATLGPLVLPYTEQLLYFASLAKRTIFGRHSSSKPCPPNFKLAFQHYCVNAAGKKVLDELQKHLGLNEANMEASRMSLHRFGNTSSSSIWYELAYLEGKEKVRRGDRVWQLAFGSGFKCNSAVWRALRIKRPTRNPWLHCLDQYPVQLQ